MRGVLRKQLYKNDIRVKEPCGRERQGDAIDLPRFGLQTTFSLNCIP
jgi:hypothetical protein